MQKTLLKYLHKNKSNATMLVLLSKALMQYLKTMRCIKAIRSPG